MKRFYFLSLIAMVLLSGCTSSYTVVEATQQEWMGGAPGSGGGIIYSVTIEKPAAQSLKIERAYYGDRQEGQYFNCRIFPAGSDTPTEFAEASVEKFRVEFRKRLPNGESAVPAPLEKAPTALPADFELGAVVFYNDKNGKEGKWVIQNFKRLEPLAYP